MRVERAIVAFGRIDGGEMTRALAFDEFGSRHVAMDRVRTLEHLIFGADDHEEGNADRR